MTANEPPPARNRYTVTLTEDLVYTIDVVAGSEEQAIEIALETERKGEPRSEHCDVEVTAVPADDTSFDAVNVCVRCEAVMDGPVLYPHCPECIEQIKKERTSQPNR